MKWYQLHLSTLLALMLLAGLLVWLNVRPIRTYDIELAAPEAVLEITARGWPTEWLLTSRWSFAIEHGSLAVDALCCVLALALTGAGIEWATAASASWRREPSRRSTRRIRRKT